MTRNEAKKQLAAARLPLLLEEDREGLLLEWVIIDPEEARFQALPETLRTALLEGEEIEDASLERYDPLILLAIEDELVGVRNEYLQAQLASFGIETGEIQGTPEVLEKCPCCGFRTLSEFGLGEICSVCFWEEDGTTDPAAYSSANDMTLQQGQENFAQLGISDDSILEFRLEHPEQIFLK